MEALSASRRDVMPHQGSLYPEFTSPEPARQMPAAQASPYGYTFASPYYGCRLSYSHNVNLQQKPCSYHPGEKYMDPSAALPVEELPGRAKEFAIYPSFAGSYQTVPGYLDVPVVPGINAHTESRHETLFPVDGYHQHWALNGWDEQLCCAKEQTHFNHLWKSQFSDVVAPSEMNGYRRGRKKRVPYTKNQLKELEREYAASKFITKDKRRRISASTSLSERQVTIWFQNRRVKEKKFVCKSKSSGHAQAV